MNLSVTKYCTMHATECRLDDIMICRGGNTVKEFLGNVYHALHLEYPKFFKMDVLAKAGFLAAELLLKNETSVDGGKTGLFLANRSSSLDTDIHYQSTIGNADYFPSPAVFVYTLANIVLGEICIRHKIYGENTFFVESEYQKERLMQYVETVFAETGLECALVGWLEVCGDTCEVEMYLVKK